MSFIYADISLNDFVYCTWLTNFLTCRFTTTWCQKEQHNETIHPRVNHPYWLTKIDENGIEERSLFDHELSFLIVNWMPLWWRPHNETRSRTWNGTVIKLKIRITLIRICWQCYPCPSESHSKGSEPHHQHGSRVM